MHRRRFASETSCICSVQPFDERRERPHSLPFERQLAAAHPIAAPSPVESLNLCWSRVGTQFRSPFSVISSSAQQAVVTGP
jgi:hypothetical protein